MTSTPVPNTATVLPFPEIAPRWLAVSDSARHSADDGEPLRSQIRTQSLGHPGTIGSRVASTDHSDAGLVQDLGISAYIKNDRWIIDLFQLARIERIVHRQHGDTRIAPGPVPHGPTRLISPSPVIAQR